MRFNYWHQAEQQSKKLRALLQSASIVCIKVGSSLLIDAQQWHIRQAWLDTLATEIHTLMQQGKQVVLVASGSVATARTRHWDDDDTLVCKQALAAVGQPRLMTSFAQAFDACQIEIAQVLFNPSDTEDRRRHLDVRGTLEQLIKNGIVPIINENDTVSSLSLCYGDNDRLSARVAGMVNADVLLMFTDIDGLYDAPPQHNPQAQLIAEATAIDQNLMSLAGESTTRVGTGGMRTKLLAAEICLGSNCHMILTSGQPEYPIRTMLSGGRATVFRAEGSPLQARKRWLAGMLSPMGDIIVDPGAVSAITAGKSLLAAGVRTLGGDFQRGDAVAIVDAEGKQVAVGITHYHAREIDQIKGKKSAEISSILGYVRETTIIHSNNLAVR